MNIKTKKVNAHFLSNTDFKSMVYLKQVYPSSVKQLRDESFWSAEELLCVGVDPVRLLWYPEWFVVS